MLMQSGHSPYARWFDSLDARAAAKVTAAVTRMSLGNFSNVKGVGGGVHEYRLDCGPGYRIYFGRDGDSSTKRNGAFRVTTGMKAAAGQTSSVPA